MLVLGVQTFFIGLVAEIMLLRGPRRSCTNICDIRSRVCSSSRCSVWL